MSGDDQRFLLARPTGGVTDMLGEIGRCVSYCQRTKRYLVIDTELEDFFAEDFSNYFTFSDSSLGVTNFGVQLRNQLSALPIHPRALRGRLLSYKPKRIPSELRTSISMQLGHFTNFWDEITRTPLTFDMSKDYAEPLLLHHCSGGGLHNALRALGVLQPTERLRESVRLELASLPNAYYAIHVRNTDLKSDIKAVRRRIRELDDTPILICSDDMTLVHRLRNSIPDANLYSITEKSSYSKIHVRKRTLHKNNPNLPRQDVNTDVFVELIAMALSNEFYAAPLRENKIKPISGFSQLVQGLKSNPSLLNKFL